MKYQVKWVQENLGITRRVLRLYEEYGLLPANNGKYRTYSKEELEYIWKLRMLQGMGFQLKDIAKMSKDPDAYDFNVELDIKITEMEKKKEEIDFYSGYAKMIRFTGRAPSLPKDFGKITIQEFQKKALEEWNVNGSPIRDENLDLMNRLKNGKMNETEDFEKLMNILEEFQEYVIPSKIRTLDEMVVQIIEHRELGYSSQEIQFLVSIIYKATLDSCDLDYVPTKEQFGRSYAGNYMNDGEIAKNNRQKYGLEICKFIADASAYFGGYKDFEDLQTSGNY